MKLAVRTHLVIREPLLHPKASYYNHLIFVSSLSLEDKKEHKDSLSVRWARAMMFFPNETHLSLYKTLSNPKPFPVPSLLRSLIHSLFFLLFSLLH